MSNVKRALLVLLACESGKSLLFFCLRAVLRFLQALVPTSSTRKKIGDCAFIADWSESHQSHKLFLLTQANSCFMLRLSFFQPNSLIFVHIVFNCLLDVFIYQRYLSLDAIISRILFFHHYLILLEEHRASTECICITQFPLNVLLRVSCGRYCLSLVGSS